MAGPLGHDPSNILAAKRVSPRKPMQSPCMQRVISLWDRLPLAVSYNYSILLFMKSVKRFRVIFEKIFLFFLRRLFLFFGSLFFLQSADFFMAEQANLSSRRPSVQNRPNNRAKKSPKSILR